jgi:hypothetical protein
MLREVVTLWVCVLATSACTMEERYPIESSLADLNGSVPHAANSAYMELYRGRASSVPRLVENADRRQVFAGDAYRSATSSLVDESPTQGTISLYLIEAIRVGHERPTIRPVLVDTAGTIPTDGQQRAAEAYRAWWRALPKHDLPSIQAARDPLEGSGLQWR